MVDKHRINLIHCAFPCKGGQGRQSLWSAAGCLTGPQIVIQGSLPPAIQGSAIQGPQLESTARPDRKILLSEAPPRPVPLHGSDTRTRPVEPGPFSKVPVRDAQLKNENGKRKTHRPPTKGDTRNGLSQKLSLNQAFCYLPSKYIILKGEHIVSK